MPSSYNLVLKEVLGRGRFLKSILCKHDEGLVLVKVYFKRGDSIVLREYERRLAQIRDKFSNLDHPHVWPFQAECEELQHMVETLSGENRTLRDELKRLSEECEKLTSENDSIKEAISQESDEKLEDNGGLKLETNGTFG